MFIYNGNSQKVKLFFPESVTYFLGKDPINQKLYNVQSAHKLQGLLEGAVFLKKSSLEDMLIDPRGRGRERREGGGGETLIDCLF